MRLGMLIDLRTCIGCHACSVACKAEYDVPLGVFRDTVKYDSSRTIKRTTCVTQKPLASRCNLNDAIFKKVRV
jgi:Fe-S-cluster-containing dehydrogenase component